MPAQTLPPRAVAGLAPYAESSPLRADTDVAAASPTKDVAPAAVGSRGPGADVAAAGPAWRAPRAPGSSHGPGPGAAFARAAGCDAEVAVGGAGRRAGVDGDAAAAAPRAAAASASNAGPQGATPSGADLELVLAGALPHLSRRDRQQVARSCRDGRDAGNGGFEPS